MIILILAILVPIVWTRTYVYIRDTKRRWRIQEENDALERAKKLHEETELFLNPADAFKSANEQFDEAGRQIKVDWEKVGDDYTKAKARVPREQKK